MRAIPSNPPSTPMGHGLHAPGRTRSAWVDFLLSMAALLSLVGCQSNPAFIHSGYAGLCSKEVLVPPVENRTLVDLTQISTAGPLQKLTLGPGGVDVLRAVRQGIVEGLEKKGYRVIAVDSLASVPDYRQPLPAGAQPHPAGAALYCQVTQWRRGNALERNAFEIAGRLELVAASSPGRPGETLFGAELSGRVDPSASGGTVTAAGLDAAMERAGRGAVYDLPEFAVPSAAGSTAAPTSGSPTADPGKPPGG